MIAIDTNLLVYAHRTATPEHKAAQRAIEKAFDQQPCGISLPSVAEFWSIVTHPRVSKSNSKVFQHAISFFHELEKAGVEVWQAGAGFAQRLAQLAQDLGVQGVRIFDLQIGLIAFESGAREIWTHDTSFVAPPGLRVVDPL